jgi:hypothetical protein
MYNYNDEVKEGEMVRAHSMDWSEAEHGKAKGKRWQGRPRHKWVHNIKIDLGER